MRRTIMIMLVVAAIIAGLCAAPAWYSYRLARVSSTFDAANKGTSRQEIEKLIGLPDEVDPDGGEWLFWGEDQTNVPKNNGQCVLWVRYNFFLEAFGFGYSEEGRLTTKYQYHSE